jgi:ornithine racemase
MGPYPRLLIDPDKIRTNTGAICALARPHGIAVTGVTKACCGDPLVARAMLEGGAASLGDSRVDNLVRLRKAGIRTEVMLLRTPMLSEADAVVEHADASLNSDLTVLRRLSVAAGKQGTVHRVILMVDMGDLREGVLPQQVDETVKAVLALEHMKLHGIGMNLGCLGGVIPTDEKMAAFAAIVRRVEAQFGLRFAVVSGGNSANIPWLLRLGGFATGAWAVNNLRIGEAILLGRETVNRSPVQGTAQDAFTLECELIELKEKPSAPDGEVKTDAFGNRPVFTDVGTIRRGILAIGRQDVLVEGLTPLDPAVRILGSASDHLVVHVQSAGYEVGDVVKFRPSYGALMRLCTSAYVRKQSVV